MSEEWAGERHRSYDKELRKPGPELSEKQKKDLELWDIIRFYEALRNKLHRLEKYEKLVQFIANDYHELSHDKAQWQRDDWKKRCKKLIEEDYNERR